MKFKSDIEVQAGLKDSSGSNGTAGQILSSNGGTVAWTNTSTSAENVENPVKAGVAINKGQAVYVTSADGTNIIVGLASNTSEATSSKTLGLLNATVAINGFADVVQIGKLDGLNTIGANVGDPVWLGTNGNLIYGLANKPYAPAHLVYIGVVTRVNANNGEIFVTVQNGFELKEIHDVDIITTTPTNGDVLGYNGTLWVNKTVPGWLGYTPVTDARILTINGTAYDLTANRSWNVGTVTSVAALTLGTTGTDLSSTIATGTTTPVITLNVPTASAANRGALSSADWSTFNTKVGSVTASSPLASSGGSTPNITIQQASGSQNGYLSSTDWATFNSKQASGNYITSLTGEATASGPGAASVTLNNASVTAKVLTGINITGGTVQATDTMLTAFGKLQNQINGLIGSSIYQGTWNAATNTPTLASSVGTRGYYYIVNVAGTTNLDGITDWFVGDWVIFDGTAWQQVDNTDAVVSVNGQTGAVSLTTDNIPEGATNQYYLNSRARSALSFTAGSGSYNSTTGVITIPTNTSQLTNGSNFITLASLSGTAPITYNNTTGAISITQSGTASNGYLSSTDWNTFNNKQNALTNPVTGTGTTNYIPKFTGASSLGNSLIYEDSNGSLGLGTTSPNYSTSVRRVIDINGSTQSMLVLSNGGTAGAYLYNTASSLELNAVGAKPIYLSNNGAIRTTIDASGNVGIGTSSPINGGGAAKWLTIDGTTNYSGGLVASINGNAKAYFYSQDNYAIVQGASSQGVKLMPNGADGVTVFSNGNVFIGTSPTDAGYKLDVNGSSRFQGYLNTNNSFEKVFSEAISFPNGTANLAADVRLGNVSFWGYIEVEVNSTYSNQNATGKLTKVFAVGTNPGNLIYTNEARVVDSMGTIPDNIAIGDFSWDSTNSTYRIPISHIVSSGNVFTVKVRMFTSESGAKRVFDGMSIGSNYTLTALARQYVYYNDRVGIGTTSPSDALHVATSNEYQISWNRTIAGKRWALGVDSAATFIGNRTDNTIPFYLTNGGNVGIGTTNPNSNGGASARVVHIHGPASGDWAVNHYTNLNTGANADDGTVVGIIGSGRDMYIFNYEDSNVIIGTNSAERIRITSGGNVLIGLTSDAGYKLDVNGSARFSSAVVGTSNVNSNNTKIQIASTAASNKLGFSGGANNITEENLYVWNFTTGVSTGIYFQSNGTITASGGFFNSDMRLKDLTDYDYNVSDIKPITYLWKDGRDNKKHVGYSAQEVQKVMPDAVNEDAEGMLSVNYIEVLVAKIAELENRIKQLEK